MRKVNFSVLFLCFNSIGFSQIPNLPTIQSPVQNTFQNYSDTNLLNSSKSNVPAVPQNYINSRSSAIDKQNWEMQQRDFRKVAEENAENEKKEYYAKINTLESSGYNLPSLSSKSGTNAYYDAYSKLSAIDSENYSLTEANFIVENAYYGNKLNFSQFKSGISKTANQLLQKMKSEKLDTDDNTMKNISLFKHFSKSFKYDFDDYMGKKDWSKMFASKLLKTGTGQCHSMPLLYLMVAESMNADASLAMAPNHTYIRFMDDDNQWQNVELTNGIFTTNSMILESGYIGSEALQSNVYMNSLSKKELISQLYADLANGYIHKFGMDEFVGKTLDKALEFYPNNMYANLLKSMYQQARFEYVAETIGIKNVENPEELQNIRYFPKAAELLKETKSQFDKIDQLGFKFMPDGAYSEWLNNMGREANRQESEAIAERIKQMNAERQKKKQEEAVKKSQEEKRKKQEKKREEEEKRRLFYLKT